MYGIPSSEALRAFEADVAKAVNAAVKQVAEQHGFSDGQVLILGTGPQGDEEADEAKKLLATIRSLVN